MSDAVRPRLLIVEDDPDLRRILSLLLGSRGYETATAENGAAGFEALQGDLPDCVILDLMMPVMDGFELLKRIRTVSRTSRLPVLILTASEDERHRLKSTQYLADAYANKPYNVDELVAILGRLLATPAAASS